LFGECRMEQVQNDLRRSQGAKNELAERRAIERSMQRPQLMEYNNEPVPTEPQPRSGGAAGLARVIGAGRKKKMAMKMEKEVEAESEDEMHGGAYKQGKMLGEHIKKLHGEGFLGDLVKGIASLFGMGAAGAGMAGAGMAGAGRAGGGMAGGKTYQVAHAKMSPAMDGLAGQALGGQDVPPGGVAPVAYGNVPQAPKSFERNSVGMGRAGGGMAGAGTLKITHSGEGMAGGEKKKKAPTARGLMVSRLMKEKGMSLGEASRYIKEHGGV
jgi:hypothetical protein